jgi:hypothetical protein
MEVGGKLLLARPRRAVNALEHWLR